jgi:GNAT superfamily N-acetyltransferase
MKIYEVQQNGFCISTNKSKLDIGIIHDYLSKESYWAKNIPYEVVERSIEGSLCFGLYATENLVTKQIGFARVISDCATFGYLADVFILESYRGKGLSKWLMKTIMDCPDLQGLRRWLLATKDAHGLYVQFGFSALDKPERIMGFKPFDEYPGTNS